ncbi:MAG: alpha/beta fold hydrolase [Gammaproteobacteria bacterium]|nr:alpha/beta fold hydrolase [Gammaproteobacteria bacterium]NIM72988.1 alpha/beta fold hydrolase [Gammaproteobacteria bacterium]NIN38604.1 alpha/beta fold hydrolase [Gammaproteobacteria bacterium]NIO24740.1 alpha/beta fold hydrolase [Gammaproteobacteria bacterium]NIO65343.1 alpha/beta fold hydrolase [Gammaproteobacteria bacterium]
MNLTVDNQPVYAYTGAREFDPSQDALIFVHGGGLDHTVWLLQSRYFAHHGRAVLAVDLPGHGKSGGQPLSSIADMGDWIVRLMDAAGVESAILVGHSMGALVVHEAAARHPERIRCIVTIGISVPMPVSDALLSAAKANQHDAFDMVNIWGHGSRAHMGGNQTPGMWMIGAGVRLLERSGPGVLYADLNACNEYRDGLESSARIECPVHVILGADDRMSPVRAARPLLETLSDPHVTVLENCGHMLMAERPGEVLDILIAALEPRRG